MRKTLILLASVALIVLLASGVALLVADNPARAAFPGENGKIAFVREVHRFSQVFTMGPAGGKQTQLTFKETGSGWSPTWSPGGRKIAYVRYSASSGSTDIYMMNADGTHKVPITTNGKDDYDPAWSPSGQRLVFLRDVVDEQHHWNFDLFTVSRDGSNVVRLTRTEAAEASPAWSPDGVTIAFSKLTSSPDCYGVGLFVMKADGSEEPSLLVSPETLGCPERSFGVDWSPDGQWIVFSEGSIYSWQSLTKVRADGTELTQLSPCCGVSPAWSPNGEKIVFSGGRLLYKMNADGTGTESITEGWMPSWQPFK
jgi:TolB protein